MLQRFFLLALAFLTLTQPNGLSVYVHTDAVEYVAEAIRGETDPRAKASIQLGSGQRLYVRETAKDIHDKLEEMDDEVHSRSKGR